MVHNNRPAIKIDLSTEGGTLPKGMNHGPLLDAHAANTIRDLFFANEGRIRKDLMANAIGRYSFTYGQEIHDAWARLVKEEYVLDGGDDWVWPMALPTGRC